MSEPGESESQSILERDVQFYLAENLSSALNEALELVGKEVSVPFGRIDVLARDASGRLVAIELKVGVASRDAIGQLQSYMGALQVQYPGIIVRGILVAASLDDKAEAALSVARNIQFWSYNVRFTFRQVKESPKESLVSAPKSLHPNSSRFCDNCRAVTPTSEGLRGRNYEYVCTNCGDLTVFRG